MSFVVRRSCVPNSDVYIYRLAVYTPNVVSENDRCVSWAVALQLDPSATLNDTKDVFDNVGVIQYAERPHI